MKLIETKYLNFEIRGTDKTVVVCRWNGEKMEFLGDGGICTDSVKEFLGSTFEENDPFQFPDEESAKQAIELYYSKRIPFQDYADLIDNTKVDTPSVRAEHGNFLGFNINSMNRGGVPRFYADQGDYYITRQGNLETNCSNGWFLTKSDCIAAICAYHMMETATPVENMVLAVLANIADRKQTPTIKQLRNDGHVVRVFHRPNGRKSTVVSVTKDGVTKLGAAWCCPKDQYVKKEGARLALKRALSGDTGHQLDAIKELTGDN